MMTLAEALQFTNDDLAANRAGQLSGAQAARLRRNVRRTLTAILAIVFFSILLATVLIFLGQQNGSVVLTLVGIVLTIFNAGVVGFGVQSWARYRIDVGATPVLAQEGEVARTLRLVGRTPLYIVTFQGSRIAVSKDAFNAFGEGTTFRLYRSAGSKTLLSAEKVS